MKQVNHEVPERNPLPEEAVQGGGEEENQDLKDQQASASVNRPAAASVIRRPVISKGQKFKNTEEDESDDEREPDHGQHLSGSRMVFKYFSGQD